MILNAVVASYVLALIAVPVVLIFHSASGGIRRTGCSHSDGQNHEASPGEMGQSIPQASANRFGKLRHAGIFGIGLAFCSLLDAEVAGWPFCFQRALKHWKT